MLMRSVAVLVLAALALPAASNKGTPKGSAANDLVRIEAAGYFNQESAKAFLGQDPGPGVLVVEVTVTPAKGKPLKISLDDFLLRTDNDGQRAVAASPSQIAGSAVMVISSMGGQQGAPMSGNRGRPYGVPGIPGSGPMPGTVPDPASAGGQATADTSSAAASIENSGAGKGDSPLLALLKQRVLAEMELAEPTQGLLYFIIDGKQKTKDMELIYKSPAGRVSVRFKDPK
jgi:hypothetical protein